MVKIAKVVKEDLDSLKTVIDSSELFPSELLEDMVADYFNNPESTDIWLAATIDDGTIVALAYCAPERMTEGTYNLYLIAAHKSYQGKGVGSSLMGFLEAQLKANSVRVLLVETSGLPEFELTRKFYDKNGYTREAVIRDFYKEGENKVVFWKKLNGTSN